VKQNLFLKKVCVSECPKKDDDFSSYRIQNTQNLIDLKQSLICKYTVNVTAIKSKDTIKNPVNIGRIKVYVYLVAHIIPLH
jgi:hypothetical protein